jgi:ABC-type dipeptide/oligopeptide/nickel transport system permease component
MFRAGEKEISQEQMTKMTRAYGFSSSLLFKYVYYIKNNAKNSGCNRVTTI